MEEEFQVKASESWGLAELGLEAGACLSRHVSHITSKTRGGETCRPAAGYCAKVFLHQEGLEQRLLMFSSFCMLIWWLKYSSHSKSQPIFGQYFIQIYAKCLITSVAIVVEGCDFYGFLCQLWWILLWGPTWVVFISTERSHALLPTLSRTERRLAACPCFGPLAINFPTWLRTIIDDSLSTSQAKICGCFTIEHFFMLF